ncbi:hypothetical protein D3C77_312060 [compost metagenome]
MSSYPPAIAIFHRTLLKLKGIMETLEPAFQVIDNLNRSLELALKLDQIPIK